VALILTPVWTDALALHRSPWRWCLDRHPRAALLAVVLQYPTDLPNGARFICKLGDREPALLANLFTHDFEDWISIHVRAAVVTTAAVTAAAARQGRDPRATASVRVIFARWRSCTVDRS